MISVMKILAGRGNFKTNPDVAIETQEFRYSLISKSFPSLRTSVLLDIFKENKTPEKVSYDVWDWNKDANGKGKYRRLGEERTVESR